MPVCTCPSGDRSTLRIVQRCIDAAKGADKTMLIGPTLDPSAWRLVSRWWVAGELVVSWCWEMLGTELTDPWVSLWVVLLLLDFLFCPELVLESQWRWRLYVCMHIVAPACGWVSYCCCYFLWLYCMVIQNAAQKRPTKKQLSCLHMFTRQALIFLGA